MKTTRPSHAIFHTTPIMILLLLFGTAMIMAGCAKEPAPETDPPATETVQPVTLDPIAHGRVTYEQYCMGCHGEDGGGAGELLTDLESLPANLTRLTIRNDGSFPVDLIYETIDGRKDVEAHGSREMPVWGNIWSEQDGTPMQEEVVQQRINELIEYIRSVQEEEEE